MKDNIIAYDFVNKAYINIEALDCEHESIEMQTLRITVRNILENIKDTLTDSYYETIFKVESIDDNLKL